MPFLLCVLCNLRAKSVFSAISARAIGTTECTDVDSSEPELL